MARLVLPCKFFGLAFYVAVVFAALPRRPQWAQTPTPRCLGIIILLRLAVVLPAATLQHRRGHVTTLCTQSRCDSLARIVPCLRACIAYFICCFLFNACQDANAVGRLPAQACCVAGLTFLHVVLSVQKQ